MISAQLLYRQPPAGHSRPLGLAPNRNISLSGSFTGISKTRDQLKYEKQLTLTVRH